VDRLPGTILPLLLPLQIQPGHPELVESPRPVLSRSSEELGTTTDLGKQKGSTRGLEDPSTQAPKHRNTGILESLSARVLECLNP
jgi:hypothetical protein